MLYITTTLNQSQAPPSRFLHTVEFARVYPWRTRDEAALECRNHRRRRPDRLCPRLPRRLRRDAGCRPTRQPAPAGDHAGPAHAARRADGAQRLRVPHTQQGGGDRRCARGLQGLPCSPARRRSPSRTWHGAQGPAARQRADFLGARQGAERRRSARRARARGGQSGQYQRPHRHEERAQPQAAELHGDDSSRSQPRALAARRKRPARTSTTSRR